MRDPQDAVLHVLGDYPRLVPDLRKLRAKVARLDEEGANLNARIGPYSKPIGLFWSIRPVHHSVSPASSPSLQLAGP
ncbi:hypothetical protein D9M68_756320 [compost metagenome]